jgi:hypothetical protein
MDREEALLKAAKAAMQLAVKEYATAMEYPSEAVSVDDMMGLIHAVSYVMGNTAKQMVNMEVNEAIAQAIAITQNGVGG